MRSIALILVATFGLSGCAIGYVGENSVWGVAWGSGRIGDCVERPTRPEAEQGMDRTSKQGYCVAGSSISSILGDLLLAIGGLFVVR